MKHFNPGHDEFTAIWRLELKEVLFGGTEVPRRDCISSCTKPDITLTKLIEPGPFDNCAVEVLRRYTPSMTGAHVESSVVMLKIVSAGRL